MIEPFYYLGLVDEEGLSCQGVLEGRVTPINTTNIKDVMVKTKAV